MPGVIRRRLVIALGVALLVHAPAEPAAAHPVPFSYVDLRLHPGALEGSLVVHILDVAHDLNLPAADRLLDPAFAAQQADAIAKLLPGPARREVWRRRADAAVDGTRSAYPIASRCGCAFDSRWPSRPRP